MKVGMLYPHDRAAFREFARGLSEILVVEEKLPYLETALRDALYGGPDQPEVVGKELFPATSDLDADAIAPVIAAKLDIGFEARRAPAPPTLSRTPFFCSGCPHNSSTNNPDDTLLGVGIGCHTMVLLSPEGKGTITGLTQM